MFNLFGQKSKPNAGSDFNTITDKIFPVIKVEITEEGDADVTFDEDNEPVFKRIAGDLLCFYGIDRDSNFELIQQRHLPDNIGKTELDNYSQDNLLNFVNDKLKIHQTDFGGIGFSCGGDHEAALLTLTATWDLVIDRIGEPIIFGTPSKDLIIFVNANNEEAIDGLKKLIEQIHSDGERLLSKQLFTYSNGAISNF